MHEMALVRNVVDIVVEQAEKSGAAEVKTVYLTIGQGRDVVVEYLDGLFQFLARGTVAEHAELVVQTTPMTVKLVPVSPASASAMVLYSGAGGTSSLTPSRTSL